MLVHAALAASIGAGCQGAGSTGECVPEREAEAWVEHRAPPATAVSDTSFAELSIALAPDSIRRIAPGGMISVLIAGPDGAAHPDTVRLLTTEEPDRAPLWRGGELRPGTYTAHLTTAGFEAGPRRLMLAPGERVAIETTMPRTGGCESRGTTSVPRTP